MSPSKSIPMPFAQDHYDLLLKACANSAVDTGALPPVTGSTRSDLIMPKGYSYRLTKTPRMNCASPIVTIVTVTQGLPFDFLIKSLSSPAAPHANSPDRCGVEASTTPAANQTSNIGP